MANINQQGQFNPYPYGTGAQMPNYSVQPQPQPMVQQYFIPQNQPSNFTSQQGITIIPVNSDDQIVNYPVASGNTLGFINFSTNRMCFKSANINGAPVCSYRWATIVYDEQEPQQQNAQQNQNEAIASQAQNTVSREEFEELKSMLAVALSNNQQNNSSNNEQRQNSRYNGKRGNRNDESRTIPANNV